MSIFTDGDQTPVFQIIESLIVLSYFSFNSMDEMVREEREGGDLCI